MYKHINVNIAYNLYIKLNLNNLIYYNYIVIY